MIRVVPFKAEHLFILNDTGSLTWLMPGRLTVEDFRHLEKTPYAVSCLDENGEIMMCAGVCELWQNRAMAWAYFNKKCRKHLVACTRVVERFFDVCPYQRVEATVDCDFERGHRWVKLLGFELEADRMKHYSPFGTDQALYARIQKGSH